MSSPQFIRAISLQRAGRFSEATKAFEDVVAVDPHAPQAAAALVAIGQSQFSLRRYDDAASIFLRVLAENPSGVYRGQALFWQGRIAQARGDNATAAARFQDAVAQLPDLEAYLRVQAADVLAEAKAFGGAVAQLDLAAKAPATVALHHTVTVKLAELTAKAGDAAGAAQRYRDLLDHTQNSWERSDYQFKLAQAVRAAGDPAEAQRLLFDILLRYPATSNAGSALSILNPKPGDINPLLEGLVAFYQRDNDRAAAAFQRVLRDPNGDQGRALYYLGLLAERDDRNDDAIGLFDQFLRSYGNHPLAEDVRWERAQLFEAVGRLRDALAAYREQIQAFPNGQQVNEAAFRAGLVHYQMGDSLGAAAAWVKAQDGAAIPIRTRNLFWAGKALARAGNTADARKLWQEAAGLRPGNYYANRAKTMLTGGGEPIPLNATALPAVAGDPAADAQQVADWLTSWAAGGQPLASVDETRRALLADPQFQRGEALLALGLRSEAIDEFRELRNDRRRDPVAQVALIGLFHDRELHQLAATAAYALLDLSGQAQTQVPAAVQRAISPAPFADLLDQEATRRGVDPFLFLALIQQESAFDAGATSSAAALGLTQVMPATGKELARQLGIRDFEPEDLYRPAVSLQLGAQYLADQLRRFNGNAMQALAAYNAGPGAVQRWARAAGGDADLFVEEIDYSQTATYVKKIAENAARYRALYGGG
jgi:soluble lytic murein transglycosylase